MDPQAREQLLILLSSALPVLDRIKDRRDRIPRNNVDKFNRGLEWTKQDFPFINNVLKELNQFQAMNPTEMKLSIPDELVFGLPSKEDGEDTSNFSEVGSTFERAVIILAERSAISAQWVSTDNAAVQRIIGALANSLKELLRTLRESNSANSKLTLDPIEKAQLIAMLEAALAEIKGPYVDKSRFAFLMTGLRNLLTTAIKKEATELLDGGLSETVRAGKELAEHLVKGGGLPHWPFW